MGKRSVGVVVLDTLSGIFDGVRRVFGGERSVVPGVVVGSLATLVGTAALVVAFLWSPSSSAPVADSGPSTGTSGSADGGHPAASAQQAPSVTAAATSPTPTVSKSAPGTTPASNPRTDPSPLPLTARFASQDAGLAGYSGSVTVTNPGAVPVNGWTVVITLPRSTLTVSGVTGASVRRDGATWYFTPDQGNAQVAGGKSVTVTFRVNGAALLDAAPTGCTIDGRRCEGS
jgi:cellulose binding protein with CBM2 domain